MNIGKTTVPQAVLENLSSAENHSKLMLLQVSQNVICTHDNFNIMIVVRPGARS